ncbi:MAG: hypothetical protein AAFY36_02680 [Bacteroidota bacterium]
MTSLRINLWSSPRNLSTALMYSFAQRADTVVLDEPLYGHYLRHQPTKAEHPGREEVIEAQPESGEEVVERLLYEDFGKPILICKQMTHHLIDLSADFLLSMRNVLLIRDPRAILASYSRVVDEVTAYDVGLSRQLWLYEFLREAGMPPVVVDATRLRNDPEAQIAALCHRLGINFEPTMLHWPDGPKPYDGVWAKYWYAGVHKSVAFKPISDSRVSLPSDLETIADQYKDRYNTLLRQAL